MSEVKEIVDKKAAFLKGFEGKEFSHEAVEDKLNVARLAVSELPVPTTRTEDWKYTRVGRIINQNWSVSDSKTPISEDDLATGEGLQQMVFVDGHYREDLSSVSAQSGIDVYQVSTGLDQKEFADLFGSVAGDDRRIFSAINAAYLSGGCAIRVAKNTTLDSPIHLLQVSANAESVANLRHLIILEEGASADFVMSNQSLTDGRALTNLVMEIKVGANAGFHLDYFQDENDNSFLISNIQASQEADSRFHINTITKRGGWVRNDLGIAVDGQNCLTNLYGTYSPIGKQHIDNHTVVDHRVPHCESNELYKGVLYGQSTGVFNGKVYVRQDAQKTNAFQQNANILMSDDATMNSKPELEIYADDVKCSHGSTTGQFDEEAVFYLKARGISDKSARQMLVEAFVGEVLEHVKNPL